MQDLNAKLAMLRLEPCTCEPAVFSAEDNCTFPPHTCERCQEKEEIEFHLLEESLAEERQDYKDLVEDMSSGFVGIDDSTDDLPF